jgi:Outer membrane protein beta-barrel domain
MDTGFTVMRKLLLMIVLCSGPMAFGQTHEIGLTLGGLFPQDRETIPDLVRLGGGTAWQANYGHQLIDGSVKLYGEVHFLGNPQRRVESTNGASTRDVATIYLTPGIRVKFLPRRSVTPYVAAGAGVAFYQQSLLQMDGQPNPAPRDIHRAALDFGAGVDTSLWRWVGFRVEIRDFYTGSPAYNLPGLSDWQHNVVAGGGFVLKW